MWAHETVIFILQLKQSALTANDDTTSVDELGNFLPKEKNNNMKKKKCFKTDF